MRQIAARSGLFTFALAALLLVSCQNGAVRREAIASTGGDPARGRESIRTYGCISCHTVPGVAEAQGKVGPSLDGIGGRVYLAGHLNNNATNLIRWIRTPQEIVPGTAMPDMGVTERDARNISAYLYTLR